jgi:hypothetical protein
LNCKQLNFSLGMMMAYHIGLFDFYTNCEVVISIVVIVKSLNVISFTFSEGNPSRNLFVLRVVISS